VRDPYDVPARTARVPFRSAVHTAKGSGWVGPSLGVVGFAKPVVEREVTLTVDGQQHSGTAWSDLSALLFVRLTLRHPTPRRGCEAGTCGSCESLVNAVPTRLCQMLSTDLDGAIVVTGALQPPEAASS
jgi:hypothetical protein